MNDRQPSTEREAKDISEAPGDAAAAAGDASTAEATRVESDALTPWESDAAAAWAFDPQEQDTADTWAAWTEAGRKALGEAQVVPPATPVAPISPLNEILVPPRVDTTVAVASLAHRVPLGDMVGVRVEAELSPLHPLLPRERVSADRDERDAPVAIPEPTSVVESLPSTASGVPIVAEAVGVDEQAGGTASAVSSPDGEGVDVGVLPGQSAVREDEHASAREGEHAPQAGPLNGDGDGPGTVGVAQDESLVQLVPKSEIDAPPSRVDVGGADINGTTTTAASVDAEVDDELADRLPFLESEDAIASESGEPPVAADATLDLFAPDEAEAAQATADDAAQVSDVALPDVAETSLVESTADAAVESSDAPAVAVSAEAAASETSIESSVAADESAAADVAEDGRANAADAVPLVQLKRPARSRRRSAPIAAQEESSTASDAAEPAIAFARKANEAEDVDLESTAYVPDAEDQADGELLGYAADGKPSRPSAGGMWTIPMLCAGICIIACCLLIPQTDANRRLAYERDRLRLDLESIRQQMATNEEFLRRIHDDPTLAERLAQRQMKTIRAGTQELPLGPTGPMEGGMSPFQLVAVRPPPTPPPYTPVGGAIANLCYNPKSRLYLMGLGLTLMAAGIVLGDGTRKA